MVGYIGQVTVRIFKDIDDDGNDVPFESPQDLDEAIMHLKSELIEAQWPVLGHGHFYTDVASDSVKNI